MKAYTTPTTTIFPIVAMIAIHNNMASFEDRDVSSGGFCMEEAAWTLADELNKEYSVLKSSFGESIKAPPITGSCAAMKERSMLLLLPLELLPELPEVLRLLLPPLLPGAGGARGRGAGAASPSSGGRGRWTGTGTSSSSGGSRFGTARCGTLLRLEEAA